MEAEPVKNFRLGEYLGTWYEIGRSKNIPYEKSYAYDIKAIYERLTDKSISVRNSCFEYEKKVSILGEAKFKNKTDTGNLIVTFGRNWFTRWLMAGPYKVIETDYKSYSIVLSDPKIFFKVRKSCWIMSRTPKVEQEKLDLLVQTVEEKIGIKKKDLIFCKHSDN